MRPDFATVDKKLIPSSSMSAEFSVNFDRDHGPVLNINSGPAAESGPRTALDSNTDLDTDLDPFLGVAIQSTDISFCHVNGDGVATISEGIIKKCIIEYTEKKNTDKSGATIGVVPTESIAQQLDISHHLELFAG
ncbi:hypothetical protein EVAR_79576_1 [Eumeta japonica]|uniref:Uncharacterized protein n=1 Tax=Eumeta variegata TaxID=151549 RepID=A0A4C1UEH2_EUMVA|nr:hypothetical protein EVAR_79576_1 [Eumeta japonica]